MSSWPILNNSPALTLYASDRVLCNINRGYITAGTDPLAESDITEATLIVIWAVQVQAKDPLLIIGSCLFPVIQRQSQRQFKAGKPATDLRHNCQGRHDTHLSVTLY